MKRMNLKRIPNRNGESGTGVQSKHGSGKRREKGGGWEREKRVRGFDSVLTLIDLRSEHKRVGIGDLGRWRMLEEEISAVKLCKNCLGHGIHITWGNRVFIFRYEPFDQNPHEYWRIHCISPRAHLSWILIERPKYKQKYSVTSEDMESDPGYPSTPLILVVKVKALFFRLIVWLICKKNGERNGVVLLKPLIRQKGVIRVRSCMHNCTWFMVHGSQSLNTFLFMYFFLIKELSIFQYYWRCNFFIERWNSYYYTKYFHVSRFNFF